MTVVLERGPFVIVGLPYAAAIDGRDTGLSSQKVELLLCLLQNDVTPWAALDAIVPNRKQVAVQIHAIRKCLPASVTIEPMRAQGYRLVGLKPLPASPAH